VASGFDLASDPMCDLRTSGGFLKACQLILRLKIGGVLWAGAPCSTWVWMARGSTGRSKGNVLGRPGVKCVQEANMVISRLAILIMLAVARGAMWCVEQPLSSLMPDHPRMRLLSRLSQTLSFCTSHE